MTALGVLVAAAMGCAPSERPVETPIPIRVYGDLAAAERVYVLLPGVRDGADAFEASGFVDIARRALGGRGRAALIAVDAHLGYYREGHIDRRLKTEVVARLKGKPVTVVGVSLGGLGALMTARRQPGLFHRVVLIAPFLGWPDDIARLRNGIRPPPGDDLGNELDAVWRWLSNGDAKPPVTLLYGRDDEFRAAYDLVAERAPSVVLRAGEGGHGWRAWTGLWRDWLARRVARGARDDILGGRPANAAPVSHP